MKIGVVGLGIAGLSAAAGLLQAGHAVTGFERFALLHDHGSSHGDTRIFRRYPFEGGPYLRLADESAKGWHDWSQQAGEDLIVDCGGIYATPHGSAFMADIARNAVQPEAMSAAQCNEAYPFFNVPADWDLLRVKEDAYIRPDATRVFLAKRIAALGGELHFEAKVEAVDVGCAAVHVDGEAHQFDALVIAAGGWTAQLLPFMSNYLTTERRTMSWYKPTMGGAASLPVFRFGPEFYGMPTPDGLLKIGHNDHFREPVDMDAPPPLTDRDAAHVDALRARFLKNVDPVAVKQARCVYTMTPDLDFIADGHPDNRNVLILSCCSGHGFKYGPSYGRMAADYFAGHALPETFSLSRFA